MQNSERNKDRQMAGKWSRRRAGSLAVCLLLTICLLAGCGGQSSTASGKGTSVSESDSNASTEAASAQEAAGQTEMGDQQVETTTAAEADQILCDETIAGWHIQVENVRVDTSMQNVSVDLGYSGVETSEYVKEAGEGKTFCIVKLKIEKEGSREQIEWEKMVLTAADGREYHRIEDTFIADLGMKHMPGSNLNFGVNEGWIAFEIDQDAEGAVLSYPFEEETFSAELGF